jgi:hypothetical protein
VTTEAEWRTAYDAKVEELARETGRVSTLIAAIEAQGHTGRIRTRQFADCPLCAALREVTQPAADHHARLAACDHPRGFGTICDVCGGDVAALMPARLAAGTEEG